jgi:hypothetical protein
LQVERVFRTKQERRALKSRGVLELNRIPGGVLSVCIQQEEEHRIADVDLVPMSHLLLLDGDAVDQGAVAASQVADGDLFAAGDHQAVPARQCGIGCPELVR